MAKVYVGLTPVKTNNGAPPLLKDIAGKSGQQYVEGCLLRASSTSGSGLPASNAVTGVIGVCAESSTPANATTRIQYYAGNESTVFEVLGATAMASSKDLYVGKKYRVVVGSTYNYRMGKTAYAGATHPLKVVGIHPDDRAKTTVGARFWVIIDNSLFETTGGNPGV